FNTPANPKNIDRMLGLFFQDAWSVASRLTLNLGIRYDRNKGILPEQSNPGGTFVAPRSISESTVVDQGLAVWRAGASYDLMGSGKTALKGSYSRYGLQVGIDRVTRVNPLSNSSQDCAWTDPNRDGKFQSSELGTCPGFASISTFYPDADGPNWPYSDEVTAGVEHQVMRDMRVGAMYYYRTNRDQLGVRNLAVPSSAYTPFTATIPGGPNGATTMTVYNLNSAFNGLQNNILDNDPYLDTKYTGIEFTANKRFSGSYRLPWSVDLAGSLISNSGYPYVSTYSLSRAAAAPTVNLTRASQTVFLSQRGEERYPSVTMVDLRISRPIKFGSRQFNPQLDIFNIGNAATVVRYNPSLGSTYLAQGEILAPRIIRVGFSID